MHMDSSCCARRGRTENVSPRKNPRGARRVGHVLLALVLALQPLPAAQAVDVYYARAIGQEFLPEPSPRTDSAQTPQQQTPELPGLGARAEEKPAASGGMSTWKKVLIGVVIVGAIAAIGNSGGGGSGEVSADLAGGSPSGSPAPSAPALPPAGSGGGNGGINIGTGGGGITLGDRDDDDDDKKGRRRR